jgi:galactokinase
MISAIQKDLQKEFFDRFQKNAEHIFFCPGRINLIGEHLDYNGGNVMPCAISQGTYLAISRNSDKLFRFECLNFPEKALLHLQSSYSKTGKAWFNYPLGIIDRLLQEGHGLSGLDMLFYGDLAIGAGLSSSASIEVLTAFALNTIFQLDIPLINIALLSKKVENEFIGVSCGIMDQFAVTMGKKNKAILLNCDTLDHEHIPFETDPYILAIINSKKQRSLTESKYNERFTECGAALKLLKQELDIQNLCAINLATFDLKKHLINDPVLRKRAHHVVSEMARVKDAVIALQTKDLQVFGKLMYSSHQSLKDLYEVSGKELDTIVDFCKTFKGCIGARMTGAGFGGCAIALVRKEAFDDFAKQLSKDYKNAIGYAPEIFASEIGDGVRELIND